MTTKLIWHSRFDGFRCAKLQVPTNHDTSSLPTDDIIPPVEIRLIMLPGPDHLQDNDYSVNGLIVNPGGPRGSVVEVTSSLGHSIPNLTGDDRVIVGFNFRVVGCIKLTADCYTFTSSGDVFRPSNANVLRRHLNRLEVSIAGEALRCVNSRAGSLRQIDEAHRAKAELGELQDQMQGNGSILRSLDTKNVARNLSEDRRCQGSMA